MKNNIKFKLTERLWLYKDDKHVIYNAELIDGEYKVTWDDSGEYSMYDTRITHELLDCGDWIEIV